MSDEDVISRGEMARQVLDNPAYQAAWEEYEVIIVEALIEVDKEDDDARRRLADAVKTLRAVRRHLEVTLETGQVTARDVAEIERGKRSFF